MQTNTKEFYLEKKHEGSDFLDVLRERYGERFRLYREDWDRAGENGYTPEAPLHINVELNNYCNLKCKMCIFAKHYHESGDNRLDMDIDALKYSLLI